MRDIRLPETFDKSIDTNTEVAYKGNKPVGFISFTKKRNS